jgi:uncharacterized protein (DUF302 family)
LARAEGNVVEEPIRIASSRSVAELVGRLETALAQRGITVFARIDHAAGAAAAGLTLRPTTVLIFGNAKTGTPLMQAEQTLGLDLPLRMLAWQDATGNTWLSYRDPAWVVRDHGIDPNTQPSVAVMTALLDALAREAA